MSKGLKIWLWFVFAVHSILVVLCAIATIINPIAAISLVLEIIFIVGIVILLFKVKKLGFYIMVGCLVVNLIVTIILIPQPENIVRALASVILFPSITYLAMRKNWDEFK